MIFGPLRYPSSFPPAPSSTGSYHPMSPPTSLSNYYTSGPVLLLTLYISMKGNTVRIPLPLHDATYHTWPPTPFYLPFFDVSIGPPSHLRSAHFTLTREGLFPSIFSISLGFFLCLLFPTLVFCRHLL